MSDLFRDEFTGGVGSLSGRTPDGVGAAYILDPNTSGVGTSLANMAVNGSGVLALTNDAAGTPYALSDITPPTRAYVLEVKFHLATGATPGADVIDVFAGKASNGAYLADIYVIYQLGDWRARFYVQDSGGNTLHESVEGLFYPAGNTHTALLTVTTNSTELRLDGTRVAWTEQVPDVYPDEVSIACFLDSGSDTTGGIESVRLYDFWEETMTNRNPLRPMPFAPGIPR